jgi:hypothetical protein
MDERPDPMKEQIEELLDRHGDEAAEEILKTARTMRRMWLVMFIVIGVVFVSVAGLIIWMIASGGPELSP